MTDVAKVFERWVGRDKLDAFILELEIVGAANALWLEQLRRIRKAAGCERAPVDDGPKELLALMEEPAKTEPK